MAEDTESQNQDPLALQALTGMLEAESLFFHRVKDELRKVSPDLSEFPNLTKDSGNDNILHITQFFYFLSELNCEDEDSIARFVKAHNDTIRGYIENEDPRRKEGQWKRAVFSKSQKDNIARNFEMFNRPVFTALDLGRFLIEHFAITTTEHLVAELYKGRLLEPRIKNDPNPTREKHRDTKDKLVTSNGLLERFYRESLLITRLKIADTLTVRELEGALDRKRAE